METTSPLRTRGLRLGAGDRMLDVALPVVALVLTLMALVSAGKRSSLPGFEDPLSPVSWLLAPVLAGLLLLRRKAPTAALIASVAALLAFYASGEPAIGLELPLVAAFFSTAERGRLRTAVIVAVILLGIAYGYRVLVAQSDFLALLGLDLMTTIVVLAAAIGAGDGVRSRAAEREARAERYRLQAELVDEELRLAVAAERQAMARDVHDVLGHSMVVISTQANVALESLGDDPEVSRSALGHVKSTAQQALAEIRGSLAVLARSENEPRHPVASLCDVEELAARFEGTDLSVTVHRDPALRDVPATVGSTAYRVVQESVTNAIRHGEASTVTVNLERQAEWLAINVSDDGRGATTFTPGNGLRGMRERVALLGGTAAARPRDGGGFEVQVRIPLNGRG